MADRCSQWTFSRCAAGLRGNSTKTGDKTDASNILLVLIAVACSDILVRKSEPTGGFLGGAGGPGQAGGAADNINGGSGLGNITR